MYLFFATLVSLQGSSASANWVSSTIVSSASPGDTDGDGLTEAQFAAISKMYVGVLSDGSFLVNVT